MYRGQQSYTVSYWLSAGTGPFYLKTVYTNRKSAAQRVRRILRNGTKNTFSGYGKIYPMHAEVCERILFSRCVI